MIKTLIYNVSKEDLYRIALSEEKVLEKLKHLVDTKEVVHNEVFNVDYIVREVMWAEDINKCEYLIDITIEILTKDIVSDTPLLMS